MKKIWGCKIGEVDLAKLPYGADTPMRDAVRSAYKKLTGEEPDFIFSGWGEELTEPERRVANEKPSEVYLIGATMGGGKDRS